MVSVDKQSTPASDSSSTQLSRREALPLLAVLALLVAPACNSEPAGTSAATVLAKLPQTRQALTELRSSNGKMNEAQYENAFVRLVNALNHDLETQFGAKGLVQFTSFNQLKIQPTLDAALENGLIVAYYPSQSRAGGGFSIEATIKYISPEAISYKLPPQRVQPDVDVSAIKFLPFSSVAETSGTMNPVGTLVNYRGAACVLVDEAQVRKNASAAGISPAALLNDVVTNEVGHFVIAKYLWQSNPQRDQRLGQVRIPSENKTLPVIQVEEAFSDYYTLAHGNGTLAYQILTSDTKAQVEQYALTNLLFDRGLRRAVATHQVELRRHGASDNLTHRELASLLHNNAALRELQPSFQAIITAEYKGFFDANLMAIKTQMEKLGK